MPEASKAPKTPQRKRRPKKAAPAITSARIAKALRLLEKHEKADRPANGEVRVALSFYRVAKRFFATGGRFRKHHKKTGKK